MIPRTEPKITWYSEAYCSQLWVFCPVSRSQCSDSLSKEQLSSHTPHHFVAPLTPVSRNRDRITRLYMCEIFCYYRASSNSLYQHFPRSFLLPHAIWQHPARYRIWFSGDSSNIAPGREREQGSRSKTFLASKIIYSELGNIAASAEITSFAAASCEGHRRPTLSNDCILKHYFSSMPLSCICCPALESI